MILLDCEDKQALLGDLYLLALTRGLQDALLASGYGPVLNATRETLRKMVAAQRVDGVILATGSERWPVARELAEKGTPCVVVDQSPVEEIRGVGWVQLDLDSGAREAARLLFDHGHRRIGFIGNSDDDPVRVAFAGELTAAGVPLLPDLTVVAGIGRQAGDTATRQLLSLREPPTAIFARTDVLASGALQAARLLGIRVPEQLSIVGHDDIPLAGTIDLTTVRIDCTELGRAAAEVLLKLHQGRTTATVPVVRTRVVVRKTVGPPPSRGPSAVSKLREVGESA